VGSVANRNDPSTASRPTAGLSVASLTAGAFGSVGDPDGTRAITAIVALLVVLGLGLVMVAVWLFRVTRPDPEVLAPLEVMGERKWRRADPVWQRRRLDEVRPDGAEPLQPSAAPPDLDEAFDLGPAATGFDDLQDAHDHAPAVAHEGVSIPGDPLVAGRTAPAADTTAAVRRNGSLKIGPLAPPPTPAVTILPVRTVASQPEPAPADAHLDDAHVEDVEPDDVEDVEPEVVDRDVEHHVEQHDEPAPRAAPVEPQVGAVSSDGGTTPTGITRPTPEDLPDHEIDPGLMAAAMAELDAELAHRRDHDR
jgi:hypothetical protein